MILISLIHIGRLRVNMGNICVEQSKYAKAIKMYRMALDQIPDVHKGVRLRILQNIGTVFVKMGQYADAITSFEHIMEEKADFKTGNCYNTGSCTATKCTLMTLPGSNFYHKRHYFYHLHERGGGI